MVKYLSVLGMNILETIYASNLSELTIIKGQTFHLHSLKVLYLTHNTNLTQIDDTAFGNTSLIEEVTQAVIPNFIYLTD